MTPSQRKEAVEVLYRMSYHTTAEEDDAVRALVIELKESCPEGWFGTVQWDAIQMSLIKSGKWNLLEEFLGAKLSSLQRAGLEGAYKINISTW